MKTLKIFSGILYLMIIVSIISCLPEVANRFDYIRYDNGNYAECTVYTDTTKTYGRRALYYENGCVKQIFSVKNDVPYGRVKDFYEESNQKIKSTYYLKNEKIDGVVNHYDLYGNLTVKEFFFKGDFITALNYNFIDSLNHTQIDVYRQYDTIIRNHGVLIKYSLNQIKKDKSFYYDVSCPRYVSLGDSIQFKIEGFAMGNKIEKTKIQLYELQHSIGTKVDSMDFSSNDEFLTFNVMPKFMGYTYIFGIYRVYFSNDELGENVPKDFFFFQDFYVNK